jgi:DNA-binding MarR family transcriptional regulator
MDVLVKSPYILRMNNIPESLFIDRSVGLQLCRAANSWNSAVYRSLSPLGLSQVQFLLLSGLEDLCRNGEPVKQADLAYRTRIDEMMASLVLRTLEAKGLVKRLSNPLDLKAKVLILTSEGGAAARRAADPMVDCERLFFLRPTDEVVALAVGLRELAPFG